MAKKIDTRNEKVGQEQIFEIPATGKVEQLVDTVEQMDTPGWNKKSKMLAFMEEMVCVELFNSRSKNDALLVPVTNGGDVQYFMRGKKQWVKRKYVEVLARAKRIQISTPDHLDPLGNKTTKILKTPTLSYPFKVWEDKNPDGYVWLERILSEG